MIKVKLKSTHRRRRILTHQDSIISQSTILCQQSYKNMQLQSEQCNSRYLKIIRKEREHQCNTLQQNKITA